MAKQSDFARKSVTDNRVKISLKIFYKKLDLALKFGIIGTNKTNRAKWSF